MLPQQPYCLLAPRLDYFNVDALELYIRQMDGFSASYMIINVLQLTYLQVVLQNQ